MLSEGLIRKWKTLCFILLIKIINFLTEKEKLIVNIETSRLRIIPCTNDLVQTIDNQSYDNGPEITNHLKALAEDPTLLTWGSWLVIRKSDNLIIGDAGFKGKPNSEKEVEVGYGFLERYWNMGYATEAVDGLIQWALRTADVKKVIAETETDNIASIRVLEKVKMKKFKDADSMIYWESSKH